MSPEVVAHQWLGPSIRPMHGPQTSRYRDDKYPIPSEKGMGKDGWIWKERDSDRHPNGVIEGGGEKAGESKEKNEDKFKMK